MRRGVRLGIDVGTVRVGVAACDPSGLLAYPLATVARAPGPGSGIPNTKEIPSDLATIAELACEHAPLEIVVGLPRSLDGAEHAAATHARRYAVAVAALCAPIPVRLVDERLTTVDAHRNLRSSGVAGRARRRVVDQVAAVLILQAALDYERTTGTPPGVPASTRPRRRSR